MILHMEDEFVFTKEIMLRNNLVGKLIRDYHRKKHCNRRIV